MIKISVQNLKGGTGKTSTVVNLGHALALQGKKVLLIDTDSQGHIATHLGIKHDPTLYDLIASDTAVEECIVEARQNLDCIVSNKTTAALEVMLVNMPRREEVLSMRMRRVSGYDFVLIDCSPSLSLMHQNALLYSDYLLIPISMDTLALAGAASIVESGKMLLKYFEAQLKILGVIPTFYDARTNISKEVMSFIERTYTQLCNVLTPIRIDTKLKEAAAAHKTIFEYEPKSRAAEDYSRLADQISNMRFEFVYGRREEKTVDSR